VARSRSPPHRVPPTQTWQIFVKMATGKHDGQRKTISLDVNQANTLDHVKAKINEKMGIPPNHFVMMSVGGGSRLDAAVIKNMDTFYVFPDPEAIGIKVDTGKDTVTIHVKLTDTVWMLKEFIQKVTGMPSFQQRLVYGQTTIEEGQLTMNDCKLRNNHTIYAYK
jgi:hypothetical protein